MLRSKKRLKCVCTGSGTIATTNVVSPLARDGTPQWLAASVSAASCPKKPLTVSSKVRSGQNSPHLLHAESFSISQFFGEGEPGGGISGKLGDWLAALFFPSVGALEAP